MLLRTMRFPLDKFCVSARRSLPAIAAGEQPDKVDRNVRRDRQAVARRSAHARLSLTSSFLRGLRLDAEASTFRPIQWPARTVQLKVFDLIELTCRNYLGVPIPEDWRSSVR